MLVSVLTEIGRSSKAYTELCGRTEVMVTDVLMALIDQGTCMQPQISHFIPMEFPIRFDVEKSVGPLYILKGHVHVIVSKKYYISFSRLILS